MTMARTKKSLEEAMKLLRELNLIVFDPDTRTLKSVTGVCQNGKAIQLTTEVWNDGTES